MTTALVTGTFSTAAALVAPAMIQLAKSPQSSEQSDLVLVDPSYLARKP